MGKYMTPLRYIADAGAGALERLQIGDIRTAEMDPAAVSRCRPMMLFKSVVLPTPLRPISASAPPRVTFQVNIPQHWLWP